MKIKNNIVSFLHSNYVRFGSGFQITTTDLFNSYEEWCKTEKEIPFTKYQFSAYLKANQQNYNIKPDNHIENVRGFKGIKSLSINKLNCDLWIVDEIELFSNTKSKFKLQRITHNKYANWCITDGNGVYYSDYHNVLKRIEMDKRFNSYRDEDKMDAMLYKVYEFVILNNTPLKTDADISEDYNEYFAVNTPEERFKKYPFELNETYKHNGFTAYYKRLLQRENETAKSEKEDDIPNAYIQKIVYQKEQGNYIVTVKCPYCGKIHNHGFVGKFTDKQHRGEHCSYPYTPNGKGYYLKFYGGETK